MTTAEAVVDHVHHRRPDLAPVGPPQRLTGGLLNYVWRVPCRASPGGPASNIDSIIVKHAPPHLASAPEVPLDPSRAAFEARALRLFAAGQPLADLGNALLRPPRILDAHDQTLILEDCGDWPDLQEHLRAPVTATAANDPLGPLATRLGAFIGVLHRRTHEDEDVAAAFDNRPVQDTRRTVQYAAIPGLLEAVGVDDSEALGGRCEALGDALLEPGRCLVMGDLWPASILVAPAQDRPEARLIDWEFVHYGRPLQDIAHLLAHLWMLRQHAPSSAHERRMEAVADAFVEAYVDAIGAARSALWPSEERESAAVHAAAEVLVRTIGPFQDGSLYADATNDSPRVQAAVAQAATWLRDPQACTLFDRI